MRDLSSNTQRLRSQVYVCVCVFADTPLLQPHQELWNEFTQLRANLVFKKFPLDTRKKAKNLFVNLQVIAYYNKWFIAWPSALHTHTRTLTSHPNVIEYK